MPQWEKAGKSILRVGHGDGLTIGLHIQCNRSGDPRYEPCITCMSLRLGLPRMPCFKAEITEAALFRLRMYSTYSLTCTYTRANFTQSPPRITRSTIGDLESKCAN